jgi:hypothetical protein
METVACWSGDRLLTLHAAGLALPDGRALALLGESGSGKTTLAAALCAEGHALLSDDVLPVLPDGRVLGLQSRLCLKQGSWPVVDGFLPARRVSPQIDWFGRPACLVSPPTVHRGEPLPLGVAILPTYSPAAVPRCEPVDPVTLLRRIVETRAILAPLDQGRLELLLNWVARIPAYRIEYPDLASGLRLVRKLVRLSAVRCL